MGKYFGTDGFRGTANENLTADHAYKVGRFLGWYYGELRRRKGDDTPARIVIGKDTRRSSYMFEYSLVGGLTASGADAYLLHVTTTPSVAYISRVDSFDCGIMISASHNPYYDNGIKLINGQGEKMEDEVIDLVEAYLDGKLNAFGQDWPEVPFAHGEKIGRSVDYVAGRNRYLGYLISLGMYSFRGKKIGLDCANGAAWNIAKSVFEALGAETYVINAEPTGVNINNNAGSTHIEGLQKFVVEKGLDAGFAYDGDADRCLCVDEKGNVITGDHILYIYGRYMKERGKLINNTVVTTVMSNFGLYRAFDEIGVDYAKTAVGDKYVYEYMKEHGCCIGGEQSGHIIFSKYASTGDGILTSLKIMQVIMSREKKLSELAAPFTVYPQVLENVKVKDKAAAQADPDVRAEVDKVAAELGDSGRILVRESGTEPLVRVMVEAEQESVCRSCVDRVVNVIKLKGHTL
ncbi:MAG: phosphoglucosamine mutase [Ruminococcus sp.]|uniref:phosphoglucosamine mutase n=1 Tax=Ruminococcus sp. TaxID=41978 RepID=UPI0025FCFE87|nr:phosphoglucosamine mutase [Ruminococcus sp.]MBR5683916.1 phosphoglucosamine mutase [Ruminococcus sp.]